MFFWLCFIKSVAHWNYVLSSLSFWNMKSSWIVSSTLFSQSYLNNWLWLLLCLSYAWFHISKWQSATHIALVCDRLNRMIQPHVQITYVKYILLRDENFSLYYHYYCSQNIILCLCSMVHTKSHLLRINTLQWVEAEAVYWNLGERSDVICKTRLKYNRVNNCHFGVCNQGV